MWDDGFFFLLLLTCAANDLHDGLKGAGGEPTCRI